MFLDLDTALILKGNVLSGYGIAWIKSAIRILKWFIYFWRIFLILGSRTSSAGASLGHTIYTLRLASSALKNYNTLQKGNKAASILAAKVDT